MGHFLRPTYAAKQMECTAHLVGLDLVSVREFVHQATPSPSGRNGIDADFVTCQIHGLISSKLQNRRFCDWVEPATCLRYFCTDAPEVDDRTAAPLGHVR